MWGGRPKRVQTKPAGNRTKDCLVWNCRHGLEEACLHLLWHAVLCNVLRQGVGPSAGHLRCSHHGPDCEIHMGPHGQCFCEYPDITCMWM
eukprot:3535214-Amphidinium_carterae.1